MPFLIIRNDITKVAADAIVNPANRNLLQGSGTSRAIYQAAGEQELTASCEAIGRCDLGRAVCTPAFGLSAKYVFHAVCPAWHGGGFGEAEQLAGAYHSALELAAEYHCERVAFPLLSSGNYGYPKEQAFRIAVDTITQYVMEHDLTVYLVLYDRDSLAVSRKLFASVEEYIDDHYVAQNDESYGFGRRRRELSERRRLLEEDAAVPMLGAVPAPAASPRTARSLESLMDNLGESFTTRLLRLIDERGLKGLHRVQAVQHLPAAFLQNSVQSRLQPQKKTVLAFAVGLHLSEDETIDLLKSAGYAFSDGSSGTGSCGTVWNTKSITSIRSIRCCLNTIRNSWVRDLSPAR
ncbi:MAG: macro domain-containing protein [Faecalibacterium prausnitzii]